MALPKTGKKRHKSFAMKWRRRLRKYTGNKVGAVDISPITLHRKPPVSEEIGHIAVARAHGGGVTLHDSKGKKKVIRY